MFLSYARPAWSLSGDPPGGLAARDNDLPVFQIADRLGPRAEKEIYRSGDVGVPWRLLKKHYGDRADPYFLESLSRADYIITRDSDGEIVDYSVNRPLVVTPKFRSYILPRGRELLEERRFNLFRWVVPTVISVAALIVSVISLMVKC